MFNGLWDLQSSAKLTGQTFDAGIFFGKDNLYYQDDDVKLIGLFSFIASYGEIKRIYIKISHKLMN